MRSEKTTLLVVAVTLACCLTAFVGPSFAQSYDPAQELPEPTKWQKRVEKFGRGMTNVLLGWTEIPVTIDQKIKEKKPLQYILVTAPIVGTVKAFMRTGVGVYEVFTFAGTKPGKNYEPILEPEYLF